jgi:hypothetical protein
VVQEQEHKGVLWLDTIRPDTYDITLAPWDYDYLRDNGLLLFDDDQDDEEDAVNMEDTFYD